MLCSMSNVSVAEHAPSAQQPKQGRGRTVRSRLCSACVVCSKASMTLTWVAAGRARLTHWCQPLISEPKPPTSRSWKGRPRSACRQARHAASAASLQPVRPVRRSARTVVLSSHHTRWGAPRVGCAARGRRTHTAAGCHSGAPIPDRQHCLGLFGVIVVAPACKDVPHQLRRQVGVAPQRGCLVTRHQFKPGGADRG